MGHPISPPQPSRIKTNVKANLDVFRRPKPTPKDATDTELDRLNKLGLQNVGRAATHITTDGYKFALTQDEWRKYQEVRGGYLRDYLRQTFSAPEYRGMSNADKIAETKRAIRQASQDARDAYGQQMVAGRLNKAPSGGAKPTTPKIPLPPPSSVQPIASAVQ